MRKYLGKNLIYFLLITVVIGIAVTIPFSVARYKLSVREETPLEAQVMYAGNHAHTFVGTAQAHQECTACREINVSHSYDQTNASVAHLKSAATCIASGVYYKYCECGYHPENASYTFSAGATNPSNHTGSDNEYGGTEAVHTRWSCCKVTTSSEHTYTNKAQENLCRSCVCGYNDTAHSWTGGGSANEHRRCADCGYVDSTHSMTNVGSAGVHQQCSCGYKITNHSYSTTTQTEATCTTMGTTKYTCSCGYSYTEQDIAIDSSNHSGKIVNGGTSGVHTKYDCCEATVSTAHSYTHSGGTVVSIKATCTTKGTTTYTCTCGYTYTSQNIDIDPSNHTGTATKKVATQNVCLAYTCCNADYDTSHAYSYTCDASCNDCGYTRSASHNSVNASTSSVCKKCSYCGTSLDTSHSYSYTCDTTCNDCGYTRSASHNMVNVGSSSVHQKCSYNCGHQTTKHTYSSSVQTAATCYSMGVTKYTCDCGYNYTATDIAIDASNHNNQTTKVTVNATATQAGMTYTYCKKCGVTTSGPTVLDPTSTVSTNTYNANAGNTSFTRAQYRQGVKFDFTNNTMTSFNNLVVSRSGMNSTDLKAISQYDELDKYDKFLNATGGIAFSSIINGTHVEGNDGASYDHFIAGDTYYITFVYFTRGKSDIYFSGNYNGTIGGVGNAGAGTAADGNTNLHIWHCPGRTYDTTSGDNAKEISGVGAYRTTMKYVVNSTFSSNDDTALDCLWLYNGPNGTNTLYIAEIFVELIPAGIDTATVAPTFEQLRAGYTWDLSTIKFANGSYEPCTIKDASGKTYSTNALKVTAGGELQGFKRPIFFQAGYKYVITFKYYAIANGGTIVEYTTENGNNGFVGGPFPIPADGNAWEVVHAFDVESGGVLPSNGRYGLTYYFDPKAGGCEVYITEMKFQLLPVDTGFASFAPSTLTTSAGTGTYNFAAGSVPSINGGVAGNKATAYYIDTQNIPMYSSTSPYYSYYNEVRKKANSVLSSSGRYVFYMNKQQGVDFTFSDGRLAAHTKYTVTMRMYVDSNTVPWLNLLSMNTSGSQEAAQTSRSYTSTGVANVYDVTFTITTSNAPQVLKLYVSDHKPLSDIYIGSITFVQG